MSNIMEFNFYPRVTDDPEGILFYVLEMDGEEYISQMYRFNILVGAENAPSASDLVNSLLRKRVELDLNYRGYVKNITGVITELEYVGSKKDRLYFRLTLEPKISILKRNISSAVYLDMSIPEVIGDVISKETSAAGDISVDMSNLSRDSYPKREIICRYNESSWDFINRLMEECGIYYYFTLSAGKESDGVTLPSAETMVLSDQKSHEKTSVAPALSCYHSGLNDATALTSLNVTFKQVCKSAAGDSYDMDTTRINKLYPHDEEQIDFSSAETAALAETNTGSAIRYRSAITGDEIQNVTQLDKEIEITKAVTLSADGYCPACSAGTIVTVSDISAVSGDSYLITGIHHSGQQPVYMVSGLSLNKENRTGEIDTGYHSRITAIPSDVQYRHAISTHVPKIYGCIPAIIEGPDSSTFSPYMDELGRYRIKFPFDKDTRLSGNSSCWIKLMTPYGGNVNTIGMHFPLLKDTQVLIGFIEGDINHPYIMGTLQDGSGSIVTSKRIMNNIIRTPGGNLFAMNDATSQGGESILMKNSYGYSSRGPSSDDLLNM